jgi:Concanavalin A-like lectin/glucanases superfamily
MRLIRVCMPLAAAVVAMVTAGSTWAKNTADYRFEGNFKNSSGPAADLAKFGPGGDFVRRRIGGPKQGVWKWPLGTGVQLKHAFKALDHKGRSYTFVMLVNLDSVSPSPIDGFGKLIDFDRDEERGLYVHDGALVPYDLDESGSVMQAGAWYQIAMTRSKDGTVKLYIDGVCPPADVCLAFNFLLNRDDPDKTQVLGEKGVLTFFVDDKGPMFEQTSGMVARLRIYDDPLSKKRIKHLIG